MHKLLVSLNIGLIRLYQFLFSPFFINKCRYLPSCSEYYIESLKIHGFVKGSYYGIKRIMSCHPFKFLGGGSGLNFVPKKKIIKERNNG